MKNIAISFLLALLTTTALADCVDQYSAEIRSIKSNKNSVSNYQDSEADNSRARLSDLKKMESLLIEIRQVLADPDREPGDALLNLKSDLLRLTSSVSHMHPKHFASILGMRLNPYYAYSFCREGNRLMGYSDLLGELVNQYVQ